VNEAHGVAEVDCSECQRWRRVQPDCRPIGPCPWADTDAAAR